ncbi:maleylacetate reductase [Streptomyces acidiscabies]|uniref:Maleylacetate reductase n=1 Tax=Streptomyces acidiscabies TaxID=42234 RepID=A0AAP6BC31_9ACTN|nr:maleylacetate reductase [Streptomyces acidiscabies]MBP5935784.1 maleylacetate reductase [Streptomyces sp. LBUM 1476]MBZ3916316.1 maleylacetate reductase [Streptomyces acidiscabies]MDX2962011.1 maleylacetate reductase [Streptomyces acidiscabies]MDX3017992.1 maleylacetate reductase [Streptomyces acidiscabies]MDX3791235.1 maleylacetate reductase [Streptomyces acidiscabies]
MRFTHETLPQRVVFAAQGSPAAVAAEVEALGGTKVMLIASDREQELADPIDKEIPVVLRHEEVVMHVPVEVAERARRAAADVGVDILVSVGGGSTTGLAKAVAMTTGLPIVAVPTTYAGSEATNVWGLTEGETKTTGVDDKVLPASVVYDAALLTTLPGGMTVASGLNAMAHCVDSMWGPRADPIDRALAQEGIRALATGLPVVAVDSTSVQGIEQTLYGAYLAAVAFASAGSGMHHKICHVLGGMFNLPHAQTHAVVLPYVLAFNAPQAPEAEARIAQALGTGSGTPTASTGLAALREVLGAPRALRDYGMPEDGIAKALAPIIKAIPANNPTPVTHANLTLLLRAAWAGEPIS